MISIITSTFDRPKLLKRCIESVQNQSYQDYEHIIVQDGKDPKTKKVVESYNDPKIRYFEIEHFGNHSRPKNFGTKQAKGEYLAYLDDDVALRPDHLLILLKEIDKADIVYGDRWVIDDVGLGENGAKMPSSVGRSSDFRLDILMKANFIDTSDALIRREVLFNLGGWDERYQKYLDWNLWVRAAKYGYTFKHVPMVITDYHMVKGCMSMQTLDSDGMMRPKWDAVDCEIEVPYLKKVVEPKVAIFTLTYNRLSETTVSFGTLHNTANYPFTHIVVDNGSSDGTVEYLKEYAKDKDVQLIINADNKGISIASNQALDWAKGKYDIIVKVDNDAIFKTKKWLSKMVEIWKANRKIALSCYVSGLRDNPGGAPRVVYGTLKGELVGMARHLGGITHFVDARAYDEFRWPEEETLHGNQDVEFSMYLTSQNYQMAYLENYFVNHGLDGTEGQQKKYKDYFEKRKWEKCHVYGDKYEK